MLIGVAVYAVTLAVMSEVMRVREDSAWYWLPFIASAVGVLVAVRPWRAIVGGNRGYALAATAGSVLVVLAADLFGAVWYSCVKGVCL